MMEMVEQQDLFFILLAKEFDEIVALRLSVIIKRYKKNTMNLSRY